MPQQPDDQSDDGQYDYDQYDDDQYDDDQYDYEAIDRAFTELVSGLDFDTEPTQLPGSPHSPTVIDPDLDDESPDSSGIGDNHTIEDNHTKNDHTGNNDTGNNGTDEPLETAESDSGRNDTDADELLAELERQFENQESRPDHSWNDEQTSGSPHDAASRHSGPGGRRPGIFNLRRGDSAPWGTRRSTPENKAEQGRWHTIWRDDELGSAESSEDSLPWELDDADTDPDEGKPDPPPWPRLPAAVLLGWIGIFGAISIVVIASTGIALPRWAGWVAIAAFAGGFGLLLSRLPQHQPPDSSNGARL